MDMRHWDVHKALDEYFDAQHDLSDRWVAANGGNELPTWCGDRRAWFLYVYNPAQNNHGWLNLDTDIVETESPFQRRSE